MAVTTFIPELWSARLLYALDKAHVATNLVNRDYEGEIKQQGDKVHINSIGAITINNYTKNSTKITPEQLTTTDQTLEITQAKYFAFYVDDIDKVQAAGDLIDTAMGRAGYGLADEADKYLLGVIAGGVDPNNVVNDKSALVTLTKDNIYENIIALRTKLDKANVPTEDRSIVIPPEAYALLLQDERFVKSDATAGQDALINGMVGRVAGFTVYESNNVATASDGGSGSDTYYMITAQVNTATTYAEQIVETEAYRPQDSFSDAVKGLHVYGAKVTDGKQIAVLNAKFSE